MSDITTYTATIRIITINDIYQNLPDSHGQGGWSTLTTLINQYRTNTLNKSIVIINGDFIGGSQLAEYTQGRYVIEILNYIGVDYVVIGNHELDFTADGLIQCMTQSQCNNHQMIWLGSNVRYNDSQRTLFPCITDYATEHIKLHRKSPSHNTNSASHTNSTLLNDTMDSTIGIFGLTTPATPLLSFPGDNIIFDDLKSHCTRVINNLSSSDCIIAVTHLSMTEDKMIAQHSTTCQKSITLCLAGHDHEIAIATVDDTTIVKSGQNGNHLGVIDLTIDIDIDNVTNQRTCHTYMSYQFVLNKDVECDTEILNIVNKYQKEMDNDTPYSDLDQVISTVQYDSTLPDGMFDVCDSYICTHSSIVRTQETVFAQLIADSMHHHYIDELCDCAIINGGFIRNNSVYPLNSQLTIRQLLNEVPFPKCVVLVRIAGRYIKQALETMLSQYPIATGVFVSGLSSTLQVHVDYAQESMHRIKCIYINNTVLDENKLYKIAITKFMFLGGDHNEAFTHGTQISTDQYKVADVFVKYITQHKQTIDPRLKRRLIIT